MHNIKEVIVVSFSSPSNKEADENSISPGVNLGVGTLHFQSLKKESVSICRSTKQW